MLFLQVIKNSLYERTHIRPMRFYSGPLTVTNIIIKTRNILRHLVFVLQSCINFFSTKYSVEILNEIFYLNYTSATSRLLWFLVNIG